MYTLLKKRRLRWLGYTVRMNDGRIPKDLLYGELVQEKHLIDRSQLCYKDVCKRDLKDLEIDLNRWETLASDRLAWRQAVQQIIFQFEETRLALQTEAKRQRRKVRSQGDRPATDYICSQCGRDCHSRIGLSSHARRCSRATNVRHHSLPRLKGCQSFVVVCVPPKELVCLLRSWDLHVTHGQRLPM